MIKLVSTLSLLVLATVFLHAANAHEETTIVDILGQNPNFKILVTLLKITDLLDVVVKAKNVTVFAPTDAAFGRTAYALGCPYKKDNNKILKCISSVLSLEDIKQVLTYHVVPGIFPGTVVLRTPAFTALNGKMFLSRGLRLVDLAMGIRNPRLTPLLLDNVYNGGIVHVIDAVLLPFRSNLPNPCHYIRKTIVMANDEFVSFRRLVNAVPLCPPLKRAIRFCKKKPICRSKRGNIEIANKITLGAAVAAVVECKFVADQVTKCFTLHPGTRQDSSEKNSELPEMETPVERKDKFPTLRTN